MSLVDSDAVGRRVAAARTRARLTQAGLARAAGLDRTALAKIETGTRRISALELARIAEQTGEPFEWFLTEAPRAIVSYRAGSAPATTPSIDRLIEQVARDVELLQSLGSLSVEGFAPVARPQEPGQAEGLAAEVRRLLDLPRLDPIVNLVDAVTTVGLFAFSEDLGADAPDAGTTLLEQGGVSVINSNRAVGRRRLALAHELGHYLLADEYTVDWRVGAWSDAQRTEWLLDVFARALLLPAEALRQRWTELVRRGAVRDAAVRIASEYRVDMATLATRLADLDLGGPEDLSLVRATTTTRGDIIEHDLIVAHDLEGTTLPRRYEKAVLALYRSERISAERAADSLRNTVDEAGLPPLPPVNENEIWKFTS